MKKILMMALVLAGCAAQAPNDDPAKDVTEAARQAVVTVPPALTPTIKPQLCQSCFDTTDCAFTLCGRNCILRPGGTGGCSNVEPP